MRGRLATAAVAIATTWSLQLPIAAQPAPSYWRVRPIDPQAQALLIDAWHSSPTVRTLVETLEASDLIIQIESQPILAVFRARLRFMAAAPGCRYLRVSVRVPGRRDVLLPALAHELQHAVEIARAQDVTDERTLANLFRRIGSQPKHTVFETEAALAVEERVRRELLFPARQ